MKKTILALIIGAGLCCIISEPGDHSFLGWVCWEAAWLAIIWKAGKALERITDKEAE